MSQLTLTPCPFCEGPPAIIVANAFDRSGAAPLQESYGCGGLDINAYVFCHECGADGPKHEQVIFNAEDYTAAESEGVRLWQERTNKHRYLYTASATAGLNLYPREARP